MTKLNDAFPQAAEALEQAREESITIKLDEMKDGNFRVKTVTAAGGGGENISEVPSEEYSVDVVGGKITQVAFYSRYTNAVGGHSEEKTVYYYPKGDERKHIGADVDVLEKLFPNGVPEKLSQVANELKMNLGTQTTIEISE